MRTSSGAFDMGRFVASVFDGLAMLGAGDGDRDSRFPCRSVLVDSLGSGLYGDGESGEGVTTGAETTSSRSGYSGACASGAMTTIAVDRAATPAPTTRARAMWE